MGFPKEAKIGAGSIYVAPEHKQPSSVMLMRHSSKDHLVAQGYLSLYSKGIECIGGRLIACMYLV